MKKVVLGLILALGGVPTAHAGLLDLQTYVDFGKHLVEDVKTNTGIKIERAIPYTSVDWERGEWAAGSAFPFAHIGSYWWFGGALSKDISDANGRAELVNGIRLNKITRPLANKALNALTFGNLDKVTFLQYLAESSSVGVTAGHDFGYEEKKKVVINSYGLFLGFEVVFGGTDEVVASKAKRPVYLR
jgi:hypothetical protein